MKLSYIYNISVVDTQLLGINYHYTCLKITLTVVYMPHLTDNCHDYIIAFIVILSTGTPRKMDDELKLEDLAHLMDVLHDVQIKWYSIGLQLGLAVVADLEIIKNQTTQSEQGCLCEMLIKWLRSGRATISALCKALRNRTVGEDVLAGEIERSKIIIRVKID